MDSMHPSALWSRHRDSFSADREGWIRSESPSSISSPFGASNRSIAKSTSLEHAASQDPSESSIFARTVQTPPGIAHNPATSSAFGIAYRSLIKLSSPVDFASAPFNRNRDPDVSTLYSAASIKSVPVPIRSFTMRTLQQKEQVPRPSNPPQPQQLRSVMRRSMASIEGISFGAAISGNQYSPKHNVTLPLDEAEDAARLEYENRDLAADAQPVRQSPDYVIQGTQGIVRSVVLNDRWHALTVDTVGYVGVWDIARGICVGGYEKGDVEGAMKSSNTTNESGGNQLRWSPKEALDVVQERIEGEALVHAWCTVDSGIGNLIVHVENIRAFDAEIFADEAGYGNEYTFEEDHRLNIGKWVLGNLFAPLVAQEKLMQNQAEAISGEASGETLQSPQGSGRAGINKQGAPNQLNIEARRVRSISEITATQRTPGITSVVSMLPVTPAMIPALPFDALEKVAAATEGSNIPGTPGDERLSSLGPLSPPLGSPTPKVRTRSQTVDESSSGPNHDYFSIKRRGSVSGEVSAGKSSPAPGTTAAPSQEGGEEVLTPSVSTPSTSVTPLTTPGASSATNPLKFMGKFKGFVKPKKVGATEAVELAQTPAASNLPESDKATNAKPQPPTFLQKILSKPLELPPFADVPPIDVNPMTGIIISQASSEAASGWTPVYRGLYSTQSQLEDIECLEQELPNWTIEFLLSNKVGGVVGGGGPPNIQKLNFMVVPWSGGDSKEDLPDLLSKESRLTASRYLRVRKILGYVKDKVESIEKAERRREELRQVDEHETSSVSSKGPRPSSRASQEGSRRSPHSRPPVLPGSSPLQGSVPLGQSHQPHGHHSRPRPTSSSSSRSGTSAYHHSGKHRRPSRATMNDDNTEKRPEDLFELLCHEMVLPNQMTLGAAKHFHWKGGGELVMDYRRKRKRH
ncbi:hypothetical protein FRC20_001191 [Serendipita sp. 405]|nr:hypothetical protein FRC20_001191 [Serendipita sp. 405]